jgi:hypothetical protein
VHQARDNAAVLGEVRAAVARICAAVGREPT